MHFLSAKWEHLLFVNYEVEPQILGPLVPAGTQLDPFEGKTLVSLVAFLFRDSRICGIPAVGHQCFEEVNLRFYVRPERDPDIRAVTFIREVVPKRLIPPIANTLFRENYVCEEMSHYIHPTGLSYAWGVDNNTVAAETRKPLGLPEAGSMNEFVTEHYWGYAAGPRTIEYHVEHAPWPVCEIDDFDISVNFAANYGEPFAFLGDVKPVSVLYAKGSPVSASFPRTLQRR